MADEGTKRTDARLVALVSVAILGIGLTIMAGLWLLLRSNAGSDVCPGRVVVGDATQIAEQVRKEGPYLARAASCGEYWAALQGDQLIAVRIDLPGRTCLVKWSALRNSWRCGDATVAPTDLRLWPTSVLQGGRTDNAWEINFSRT